MLGPKALDIHADQKKTSHQILDSSLFDLPTEHHI